MNEWITDEMDPDGSYREMTYENLAKQYDRYFRHVMLNIGGIYLTDLKAGTPGERVRAVRKIETKSCP
ncbi:MAG: zinc-dependent metalloprotease [Coprobacter fastidiosus]